MSATASERPIIIIRRRKKVAGHGHHGGAWKVAYADFVTAMMAFFLLLWLLNVTTDEQRGGIADYFNPASIARQTSGTGGVLGGLTIASPGPMSSPSSPISLNRSVPGRPEAVEDSTTIDEGASDDYDENAQDDIERHAMADGGRDAFDPAERPPAEVIDETLPLDETLAAREEAAFQAAEAELRQAIQSVPELAALADSLIIDETPEGLRIQIVDQERTSMFPLSSAAMHDHTRQLLGLVAGAVAGLPNAVSIAGHTDATPFANAAAYDNWDLSADRANASRRALIEAGLADDRIATVVGKADTEPLFPDEPASARNRRISIVLLREAGGVEVPR